MKPDWEDEAEWRIGLMERSTQALLVLISLGVAALWYFTTTSVSTLNTNQTELKELLDQQSARLDSLEVRVHEIVVGLNELRERDLRAAAGQVDAEARDSGAQPRRAGESTSGSESLEWPLVREKDLPERFHGRFDPGDLLLDIGDGSVGRLSFSGGTDPLAHPESRGVASDLMFAHFELSDLRRSKVLDSLRSGDYETTHSYEEADRLRSEKSRGGEAVAVQELPSGEWAVIPLLDPKKSSELRTRIRELTIELKALAGIRGARYQEYQADHEFETRLGEGH